MLMLFLGSRKCTRTIDIHEDTRQNNKHKGHRGQGMLGGRVEGNKVLHDTRKATIKDVHRASVLARRVRMVTKQQEIPQEYHRIYT